MTETMKLNLDKTLTSVKIISAIAGAIIGGFVIYMNVDSRMDNLEQKVAVSEGVQQEWMRSMENNVERIYDIVKEWEKE
jgi:glycerol uptake facilitator-like aquaporin